MRDITELVNYKDDRFEFFWSEFQEKIIVFCNGEMVDWRYVKMNTEDGALKASKSFIETRYNQ